MPLGGVAVVVRLGNSGASVDWRPYAASVGELPALEWLCRRIECWGVQNVLVAVPSVEKARVCEVLASASCRRTVLDEDELWRECVHVYRERAPTSILLISWAGLFCAEHEVTEILETHGASSCAIDVSSYPDRTEIAVVAPSATSTLARIESVSGGSVADGFHEWVDGSGAGGLLGIRKSNRGPYAQRHAAVESREELEALEELVTSTEAERLATVELRPLIAAC